MKITGTYDDTLENMTAFAQLQGWTATVVEQSVDEEGLPVETEVENPITLRDFLTTWTTKGLKDLFAKPNKQAIKIAALQQARVEQEALEVQVNDNLTVNVD